MDDYRRPDRHQQHGAAVKAETDWLPLPAVVGTATLGFPAYLVAEAALQARPHPLHWIVALGGMVAGYTGGLLYHRIRPY